jgi:hypothetical protein
VLLDDRDEDPLRLVDRLQEVDDPELRDVAREAGEIGGHDAPLLAEEIPDALIDRIAIGRRLDARRDQLLQSIFGGAVNDAPAEGHYSSSSSAPAALYFFVLL